MPIAAVTGDKYQVRFHGRVEGQETVNIMYFALTGSGDADVLTHLVVVLVACFITHLLPVLTSKWSLERVMWRKVSPALGPEQEYVPSGSLVGGGNASALPSFASALVSIHTLTAGRSGRGRLFLPGIPEADTTDSFITSGSPLHDGIVAFLACVATNFIHADEGVGAEEWSARQYSRKVGGATLPYGATGFNAVTLMVPKLLIATTRSRKVGRGS